MSDPNSTALQPPRKVHVLFIHGVGRHSRLSSLLEAYQGIRSNLRSHEAPITFEDPIPNWQLRQFADGEEPPYLRLEPRYPGAQPGPTEAIYFYEVNYSSLAGIIRANQPLDITHLFVSFDLAVNVARERLCNEPPVPKPSGFSPDHLALASQVQQLAAVCVAATVPILGVPSWILRNYTRTFVATFTRFFEDIATFALDKNGEQLISAHVDRTVESIVSGPLFSPPDSTHQEDIFVIAAHSLRTIVAHNYLVRKWGRGGRLVPTKLLTFGAPIGLVCWLWLFLDFPGLKFSTGPIGDHYFCWTPEPLSQDPLQSMEWINVVNYMDPVATAFPIDYVDLGRDPKQVSAALAGGDVAHRFLETGGAFSAGFAHTEYFDDRNGFVEILGQLTQLRPDDPSLIRQRPAGAHWRKTTIDLMLLRIVSWAIGVALVAAFLGAIAYYYQTSEVMLLLPIFAWPRATIGFLGFFQRLIYGGPTRRTPIERIKTLRWNDVAALPYLLRRAFGFGRKNPAPLSAAPGWFSKLCIGLISFLPTLVAMVVPVLMARSLSTIKVGPLFFVTEYFFTSLIVTVIFALYLLAFAVSEFAAHWRAVLLILRRPTGTPASVAHRSTSP